MNKDVIIILAGGIEQDGSLPEDPRRRVREGVELYKQGIAPRIIMTGKWGFWLEKEPSKTEAQAMKEYAIELGVPENSILTEEKSTDTVGNAYFTKIDFLKPKDWHSVIVVTSDYHTDRSKFIFENILGPDYHIEMVSVVSSFDPTELVAKKERENKSMETLRSWLEKIAPITDEKIHHILFTKHPGYAQNPEISKEELAQILGKK